MLFSVFSSGNALCFETTLARFFLWGQQAQWVSGKHCADDFLLLSFAFSSSPLRKEFDTAKVPVPSCDMLVRLFDAKTKNGKCLLPSPGVGNLLHLKSQISPFVAIRNPGEPQNYLQVQKLQLFRK